MSQFVLIEIFSESRGEARPVIRGIGDSLTSVLNVALQARLSLGNQFVSSSWAIEEVKSDVLLSLSGDHFFIIPGATSKYSVDGTVIMQKYNLGSRSQ